MGSRWIQGASPEKILRSPDTILGAVSPWAQLCKKNWDAMDTIFRYVEVKVGGWGHGGSSPRKFGDSEVLQAPFLLTSLLAL